MKLTCTLVTPDSNHLEGVLLRGCLCVCDPPCFQIHQWNRVLLHRNRRSTRTTEAPHPIHSHTAWQWKQNKAAPSQIQITDYHITSVDCPEKYHFKYLNCYSISRKSPNSLIIIIVIRAFVRRTMSASELNLRRRKDFRMFKCIVLMHRI